VPGAARCSRKPQLGRQLRIACRSPEKRFENEFGPSGRARAIICAPQVATEASPGAEAMSCRPPIGPLRKTIVRILRLGLPCGLLMARPRGESSEKTHLIEVLRRHRRAGGFMHLPSRKEDGGTEGLPGL